MQRICYILTAALCFLPAAFMAQVAIHLTINSAQSDTIVPGEPVMVRVVVSNPSLQYARAHNDAVQQNLELLERAYAAGEITQDSIEAERARLRAALQDVVPVSFDPAHFKEKMQITLDNEAIAKEGYMLCQSSSTSDRRREIGPERLLFWFGISGDVTGNWLEGTLRVQIEYDSIFSNLARLTLSSSGHGETGIERRLRHARFYLDCHDIKAASAIVDDLMHTAETIEVITLKARTLEARGAVDAALSMYRRALEMFYQQYPDSYEEPQYLLSKIAALEDRQ